MTRKIIIDTDTGSDDAVALMMCLRDPGVEIVALTTVSGNVDVDQATLNCLMSAQIALGKDNCPPVYKGADRPLYRSRVHARNVHGNDGMSDCGLIHPEIKEVPGVKACDAIIDRDCRHRPSNQPCLSHDERSRNHETPQVYLDHGHLWLWPRQHDSGL